MSVFAEILRLAQDDPLTPTSVRLIAIRDICVRAMKRDAKVEDDFTAIVADFKESVTSHHHATQHPRSKGVLPHHLRCDVMEVQAGGVRARCKLAAGHSSTDDHKF